MVGDTILGIGGTQPACQKLKAGGILKVRFVSYPLNFGKKLEGGSSMASIGQHSGV